MKIDLTDTEWIQLIDGSSKGSKLNACCGPVSELRDEIIQIVRDGRNRDRKEFELKFLYKALDNFIGSGHGLNPTLQKLCEQINYCTPNQEVTSNKDV